MLGKIPPEVLTMGGLKFMSKTLFKLQQREFKMFQKFTELFARSGLRLISSNFSKKSPKRANFGDIFKYQPNK
jgi:hypothetical protein